MKKFGLIIFIGLIFIITGCKSKANQLVCESKGMGGSVEISQKFTLNYDGDTVTNLNQKKVYSFEEEKDYKNFEPIINTTISDMKKLENKHIKFESKKSKNSYTIELDVDMKKITDKEMESLNVNKKLSEFKATLESQGLTCK